MTRRYLVLYENGAHNLSGFAPDVPGCVSTGATLDDLRTNLREALEFHLESLSLGDMPLPAAETHLVEVPENGFAEWRNVTLPTRITLSA